MSTRRLGARIGCSLWVRMKAQPHGLVRGARALLRNFDVRGLGIRKLRFGGNAAERHGSLRSRGRHRSPSSCRACSPIELPGYGAYGAHVTRGYLIGDCRKIVTERAPKGRLVRRQHPESRAVPHRRQEDHGAGWPSKWGGERRTRFSILPAGRGHDRDVEGLDE